MSHRPSLAAHRRLALVVSLCVAATSAVALATPGPTVAWSENAYSAASESELVALTNQSRAAAGRASLKVSSTLTSIARWRSKDMIKRDYFSHSIPGVGNVFDVLDDEGYCYRLAGENIGWNNEADDVATARIHTLFMDSSSHRSNILGKSWDVIGVGAYQGSDGKKMWTVLFADRAGCGSPAPATPKPTVKPKPRPTPEPTPKPTRAPRPTAEPSAATTAEPTDDATPTAEATTDAATEPTGPAEPDDGRTFPPPEPLPTDLDAIDDSVGPAGPTTDDVEDHGQRILRAADPPSLLDAIVGSVSSLFFGG